MQIFRGVSAFLGISAFLVGILFSIRYEQAFGVSAMIAGAIIISGFLISTAIREGKKP